MYFLFSIIFLVSIILIFFQYNYLYKNRIFDKPSELKSHKENYPKGMGLFITLSIVIILKIIENVFEVNFLNENIARFWTLYLSVFVLIAISFIDDFIVEINPYLRLFFQFSLCFLSITSLPIPVSYSLSIMGVSIPYKLSILMFIYIWIFITNENNFHDGIDGHASIKIFFTSLMYSYLCYINNLSNFLLVILLILSAYSFIIFYFTKRKNKFFLGDVGSVPIGFLLGWFFIYFIIKGYLIECVFISLVYTLDIIYSASKRILRGKSIIVRHRDFVFLKNFDLDKNSNRVNLFYFIFNSLNFGVLIVFNFFNINLAFIIIIGLLSVFYFFYIIEKNIFYID